MSEHHPVLQIESLSHRHPGLTSAIAAVCLRRRHVNPQTSIAHPMTNRSPFFGRHDRPKPKWHGEMRSVNGRDLPNSVAHSQPGEFRSSTNSTFLERGTE